MSDQTSTKNSSRPVTEKLQTGLGELLVLVCAFALWLFLIPDRILEPSIVAIAWTIAIVFGAAGHLLFCFVFPWRGLVMSGLVLLSPFLFLAVLSVAGVQPGRSVYILRLAMAWIRHQDWNDLFLTSIPILAYGLLLMLFHPIRPNMTNGIITALGITLWYVYALAIYMEI